MLLQPTSYTRYRTFIRIELRMWPVKHFDFIKQDHGYPTSFAFANFSTQFQKERLNIPPGNIAADWMCKYRR